MKPYYVFLDMMHWFSDSIHSGESFSLPLYIYRNALRTVSNEFNNNPVYTSIMDNNIQNSIFKLFKTDQRVETIHYMYMDVTKDLFQPQNYKTYRTEDPGIIYIVVPVSSSSTVTPLHNPLTLTTNDQNFIRDVLNVTGNVPNTGVPSYVTNTVLSTVSKPYLVLYYVYRAMLNTTTKTTLNEYRNILRTYMGGLPAPQYKVDEILTSIIVQCKLYPLIVTKLSETITT